jgi:hypothetical protein
VVEFSANYVQCCVCVCVCGMKILSWPEGTAGIKYTYFDINTLQAYGIELQVFEKHFVTSLLSSRVVLALCRPSKVIRTRRTQIWTENNKTRFFADGDHRREGVYVCK